MKGAQFYLVFIELEDGNDTTVVDDKKQEEVTCVMCMILYVSQI